MEHQKVTTVNADHSHESRAPLEASLVIIMALLLMPQIASADCTSLIKGPVAVDVLTCGSVNPEAFDLTKSKYKFIADLDPEGRKIITSQYRGLAVKGQIVRSQAIQAGLDTRKGALQGETVVLFIPPSQQAQCSALIGKRIAAQLQERCCDGAAEAPCLLDTGLTLSDIKVAGNAVTDAEGKPSGLNKPAKVRGADYKQAEKFYLQKKFKEAVASYKKAEAQNDIDVKGLVRWGFALREMEDCPSAIAPLKKVYDLSQKGKLWADEEMDGRRGIFLLARCHAKMSDPSLAVFYLNGFLLDPKKYRSELIQSLKHKDFGWIHTSKEYREYSSEAKKKLN